MSTLYKMIFNPRSPLAFLLAFIYTILATIGLFNPYKDFPTPDYPEGSINHHYSQLKDGYDEWYGYTSMQGILNMINAGDKEGIISKFSQNSTSSYDLSKQTDILFDYIDGEIIDYKTYGCSSSTNSEYGVYHDYSINPLAKIKTKKNVYVFSMFITVKNDDESLIGIRKINVIREDIDDYYMYLYDLASISGDEFILPWHQPGAINCVDYNGLIR